MTNEDAIKWLENLKNDIGNPHYAGLWHYAQAIDEIAELLKEQDELLRKLQKDKDKLCLEVSEWKHKYHDRKEQEAKPKTFTVIDVKTGEYPAEQLKAGEVGWQL